MLRSILRPLKASKKGGHIPVLGAARGAFRTLQVAYSQTGLQISIAYDSGRTTWPAYMSWAEWQRLVAWVEWQRKEDALKQSEE